MTVFYITGTSSGIGKALAEEALKLEDSIVYGFARNNSIEHHNYKHIQVDLSNTEEVSNISLEVHPKPYKVVLINNAGTIGEVKQIGNLTNSSIINLFNLNTICPVLLTNKFIQAYNGINTSIVIINISSGAARHPIESWAPYCASKASIDMFSQVLQAENGYEENRIKVFSVAPGIVDTNMQEQVRASDPNDFQHHAKFVGYKNSGQLVSPHSVAIKLMEIVEKPLEHQNVLLDVRQL